MYIFQWNLNPKILTNTKIGKRRIYSTDDDVGYVFKSLLDSQAGCRFLANCLTTLSGSPPPLRFSFSIALVFYEQKNHVLEQKCFE